MSDGGRSETAALRHMAVSGAGSLAAPLVNFLALPVITRLYTPAEVGVWALVVGVAMVLGPVSTLRLELAAVLEQEDRDAGRVLTLCLLGVLTISCISWVVVSLARPWLGDGALAASLAAHGWAVPVMVAALGVKATADGWSVRSRAFTLRAASLVTLAVGTNGGQILFRRLGMHDASGLVLGSIVGAILSAIVLMVPLFWREGARMRLFSDLPGAAVMLSRHRRFPVYSAPYSLIGSLRREGVKLVTGAWGPEALVGSVALSWRLTNFPALVFSNGIRPVLFERAARAAALADVLPFVRKLQRTLAAVVLPVLLVVEIWAEPIFAFVFGPEWSGAVPFARIFMVPAALFVCTNWLDRLFDVAGRQDLAFRLELIFSILGLGGLALGLWGSGDPLLGAMILASVLTVHYAVFAFMALRVAAGATPSGGGRA